MRRYTEATNSALARHLREEHGMTGTPVAEPVPMDTGAAEWFHQLHRDAHLDATVEALETNTAAQEALVATAFGMAASEPRLSPEAEVFARIGAARREAARA